MIKDSREYEERERVHAEAIWELERRRLSGIFRTEEQQVVDSARLRDRYVSLGKLRFSHMMARLGITFEDLIPKTDPCMHDFIHKIGENWVCTECGEIIGAVA